MADSLKQQALALELKPGAPVHINLRCQLRRQDGHCVISVAGIPVFHYAFGDTMAEAHAMVSLVEQGHAQQREVASAFEVTERTVRRHQRRFAEGGLRALGRSGGFPKGRPRQSPERADEIRDLKVKGLSNRAVALRVGITETAVRKHLKRIGWVERQTGQTEIAVPAGANPNLSGRAGPSPADQSDDPPSGANPNLSGPRVQPSVLQASAEGRDEAIADLPFTCDRDPADRRLDRLLAYLGFLEDAAPLFGSSSSVPHAGVLLAVPVLVDSGVFDVARSIYGSIGPAFYGLRTTILTLLLLALLRIKRPEALKEHSPADLGRIIGLDRAPEVKTLRRKLAVLSKFGRAASFGRALAERRVARIGAAIGFLYVDGHVRVYHGTRTIPKAHVTRMRIALPATTDYWVNDAKGDPLFVVTAEANAGMVKMLPAILEEVRRLAPGKRVTIVFDRGGWSPQLFKTLIDSGFDILTYRKAPFRAVRLGAFQKMNAVIDGAKVEYVLADQAVRLKLPKPRGRRGARSRRPVLEVRQVTRLSSGGHQTPILTSRTDLSAVEVAYRMFNRWRQENFFKYLREEYALDALVDYEVEPDNPDRQVPNPARAAIDVRLHAVEAELRALRAEYGLAMFASVDDIRAAVGKNTKTSARMIQVLGELMRLERRRAAIPAKVPVSAVAGSADAVVRLDVERKHLTNLLKMTAFNAETELVQLLAPHYKRADDEGRTLIQSALNSAADIEVTKTELRVILAPLSSPHRTRAIAEVCASLSKMGTRFPGTNLVLRFAVHEPG